MKNVFASIGLVLMLVLSGCGVKVEVPPAHVGKIMTKDGYQDNLIPTSRIRLDSCWAYCDRIVLLDVSDSAFSNPMEIFIPKDKLILNISVQATLSINPKKTQEIFNAIAPSSDAKTDENISVIDKNKVYRTYAEQIIAVESREYLSQFSISEISSSIEQINSELSARISRQLLERTPFTVRYVGITNVKYPSIITDAQENAAKRREQIQQEQAQLEISKVQLERELQEARLQRQVDTEKAQANAESQRIQAVTITPLVLELRRIENQAAWIEKWQGNVPSTILSDDVNTLMNLSK